MNVEDFFETHRYTIAALGVLGTFSAVAVALFSSVAALRVSRTSGQTRDLVTNLAQRFDVNWFLDAIQKYRRLLGEVLIASFFLQLQLFALTRRCSFRS